MTAAALRRHALRVAEDLGVTLVEVSNLPPDFGVSVLRTGTVLTRPVRTHRDYAVALHELGHQALGVGQQRRTPDGLAQEWRCWSWARRHALAWTPSMQAAAGRCLRTYEPRSPRREK